MELVSPMQLMILMFVCIHAYKSYLVNKGLKQ